MILLDTNAISEMVKSPSGPVARRVIARPVSERLTSVIVLMELEYGLARAPEATSLSAAVRAVVSTLQVLPLPVESASHYGLLRSQLQRDGRTVAENDLLIAAHARNLAATVITRNLRHFSGLPGVHAEDWSGSLN